MAKDLGFCLGLTDKAHQKNWAARVSCPLVAIRFPFSSPQLTPQSCSCVSFEKLHYSLEPMQRNLRTIYTQHSHKRVVLIDERLNAICMLVSLYRGLFNPII